MNPVTTVELVARFRPLTDAESTVAGNLLADAWAILLRQVPGLQERIDDGSLSEAAVVPVVVAMVLRVLRNPQGYRQGSRTIDDFSESWTWDNVSSAGLLYATAEELALLGPSVAQRGAFSIRALPECPVWDVRRDRCY